MLLSVGKTRNEMKEVVLEISDNDYTTISSVNKSSTDDGLGLSNILNILLTYITNVKGYFLFYLIFR